MPPEYDKGTVEPRFEGDEALPWELWGSRTVLFFVYDFWFRIAAVGFVVLLVLLGLLLPSIWLVSPPGFLPVVRVSGLDKLQAWQLGRTALAHAAESRFEDSMHAWRGAILNMPCDPALHRGSLTTLIHQDHPSREFLGLGIQNSSWLLRLTRTNRAELELVSEFYEKYELHGWNIRTLGQDGVELTASMAKRLMKAYFLTGDMTQFGVQWQQRKGEMEGDPSLQVYLAAWRLGWGLPSEATEARDAMKRFQNEPTQRLLAHRLSLQAAYAHADLSGYESSLTVLKELHADRIKDHVNLWRLLAHSQRREEAVGEARAFVTPASTPSEAQDLASAFNQLGMQDIALALLEKTTREYPWSGELWALWADILISQKRWDDLRTLALNLRVDPASRDVIGGFAYYLEGLAHWHTQHPERANVSFAKASSGPFDTPLRAYMAAVGMNRLGQSVPAADLLKKAEGTFTNQASFYNQLTIASFQGRLAETLLPAAEKAYQLDPRNRSYANNYAAALLCTRQRPAEALQITLRLLNANPKNPGARINHALALCQNARHEDAARMLEGLNPEQLLPEAVSSLNLAWFEIHVARGDFIQARRVRGHFALNTVFPNQAQWIEQTTARFPVPKG